MRTGPRVAWSPDPKVLAPPGRGFWEAYMSPALGLAKSVPAPEAEEGGRPGRRDTLNYTPHPLTPSPTPGLEQEEPDCSWASRAP